MTTSDVKVPRLLSEKELAAITGLPLFRVRELRTKGIGPPFLRVGRTYRYSEAAVAQWIAEQQSTSTKKGAGA